MYCEHWSLENRPFENRYEPDFYYPSEAHQAAMLKLRYAIENRRSATVLCGGSGMGKSLVLRNLETQIPEFAGPIVNVNYPLMDVPGLIRYVAGEIAGRDSVPVNAPVETAIHEIESAIAKLAESDRQAVVIVDEAHLLEQSNLLEPLRLLLNLGASSVNNAGESALTMILCGQPSLMAQVNRNVSLDERIAVRCILNRFSIDETVAYISHRIRAAGGNVDQIFTSEAIEKVFHCSEGIPRRINRLCDLALMVGYAQESESIDGEMINDVDREVSTPASVE